MWNIEAIFLKKKIIVTNWHAFSVPKDQIAQQCSIQIA